MENALVKGDGDPQVEVFFDSGSTYAVNDHAALPIVIVSTHLNRRGLSKILNRLLENVETIPYEFFVRLESKNEERKEGDSKNVHLKTTLARFMEHHGKTSETRLVLIYEVARCSLREKTFSKVESWIFGLSSVAYYGEYVIGCASSDGVLQIYNGKLDNNGMITGCSETAKRLQLSDSALTSVDLSQQQDAREGRFSATDATGQIVFGTFDISDDDRLVTHVYSKQRSDYGPLNRCGFNKDASIAAAAASEGKIYLWDTKTMFTHALCETDDNCEANTHNVEGNPKKRHRHKEPTEAFSSGFLFGHISAVNDLSFLSSSSVWKGDLISASSDQTIRLWDLGCLSCTTSWAVVCSATSVSPSPTPCIFATAHDDGRIRIWDTRVQAQAAGALQSTASPSQARMISSYHIHRRTVPQASWNPGNHNTIASVSHDGSLKLIDLRYSNFARQTVSYEDTKLFCVDWLDDQSLMSGGSDMLLRNMARTLPLPS